MAVQTQRLVDQPMNSNPYDYDHFRMGLSVDNRWEVMFDRHEDNDFLIIVYRPTGERWLVSAVHRQDIHTMTSLDTPL